MMNVRSSESLHPFFGSGFGDLGSRIYRSIVPGWTCHSRAIADLLVDHFSPVLSLKMFIFLKLGLFDCCGLSGVGKGSQGEGNRGLGELTFLNVVERFFIHLAVTWEETYRRREGGQRDPLGGGSGGGEWGAPLVCPLALSHLSLTMRERMTIEKDKNVQQSFS